jgi:hypothetical protein
MDSPDRDVVVPAVLVKRCPGGYVPTDSFVFQARIIEKPNNRLRNIMEPCRKRYGMKVFCPSLSAFTKGKKM